MEFSRLLPLGQLRSEYKEDFDQTFSDDESLLQDAFSYGHYHEEEFRFGIFAERLSDAELASLFLPVGHVLIRGGTVDHVVRIEEVKNLYSALADWQDGKITSKEGLLGALKKARACVFKLEPIWRPVAIPFFRVLELGVSKRLGATPEELYNLEREYRSAE
jgi:hypothetical protein